MREVPVVCKIILSNRTTWIRTVTNAYGEDSEEIKG